MIYDNHNIQFLFIKNHILIIIYYIIKYISKSEIILHSKLIIYIIMHKIIIISPQSDFNSYIMKMMFLKIYNKLDNLREIDVSETISHLLKFPNHYINATFINIHITHILRYIYDLVQYQDMEYDINIDIEENEFNSEIIIIDHEFCIIFLFDDYIYHESEFVDYCLYDYCMQFYKYRKLNDLSFNPHHSQYVYYNQFLRKINIIIISILLGKLLFIKFNSEDDKKKEDYYCLIVLMFFP